MDGQGAHEVFGCTGVVLEAQIEFVRTVDRDCRLSIGGSQEGGGAAWGRRRVDSENSGVGLGFGESHGMKVIKKGGGGGVCLRFSGEGESAGGFRAGDESMLRSER